MPRAKTEKKEDLEVLFPEQVVSTTVGDFTVHPFYVRDFTAVLELIKTYQTLITGDSSALFAGIVDKGTEGLKDAKHFIQYSCNITDEQFEELRMDDVVDLFMSAVESNRDFLFRRLQESGLRLQIVTSLSTGEILSSDS